MSYSPFPRPKGLTLIFTALLGTIVMSQSGACAETLGARDANGAFSPKVTVSVKDKEIIIKKVDPRAKFDSISLTVNKKNGALVRNAALLKLQWLTANNQGAKPVPFTGPLYNPATGVFKDSMTRSAVLKIIDSSTKDLFAGKTFGDLFTLHVDDQLCLSSESFHEKEGTVKMGAGSDLSLDIDKSKIFFNESNIRKGEIVNVDNRTGFNQTVGVSFPSKGLLYYQIIRKPEQTKVPRESWERFAVEADSGFFIVLIPEADPAQLAALQDKEVVIKVWDGAHVKETKRIPINASTEGIRPPETGAGASEPRKEETRDAQGATGPSKVPAGSGATRRTAGESAPNREASAPTGSAKGVGAGIWGALILNVILVLGIGFYTLFVVRPRVRALEEGAAKSEMFIHGSREAIREEIEEMKQEVIAQCRAAAPSSREGTSITE
jgi:hypothetical protein